MPVKCRSLGYRAFQLRKENTRVATNGSWVTTIRKISAGISGARVAQTLDRWRAFDAAGLETAGRPGTRVLVASAVLMCLSALDGVPTPLHRAGTPVLTYGACRHRYLRYLVAT